MKRVLVLGAGRVARPCVQYLLKQEGYAVTVVDLSEANLARVTGGHPRAAAIVDDGAKNTRAILESALPDVVVNLLPPPFMPSVSRQCLEAKVHQVHAIYLDGEAMSMAKDVEAAGLVFLGELGLDPGIDHMSAARTIKGSYAKPWLTNEAELDDYLNKQREAWLKEILAGNRVQI